MTHGLRDTGMDDGWRDRQMHERIEAEVRIWIERWAVKGCVDKWVEE